MNWSSLISDDFLFILIFVSFAICEGYLICMILTLVKRIPYFNVIALFLFLQMYLICYLIIDIHIGHKDTQHYCEYIVYVSLESSFYFHDMHTLASRITYIIFIKFYMFLQFDLSSYLIFTTCTR